MNRRKLTIPLTEADYAILQNHCEARDEPMTVWVKRHIKAGIESESTALEVQLDTRSRLLLDAKAKAAGMTPELWIRLQVMGQVRGL